MNEDPKAWPVHGMDAQGRIRVVGFCPMGCGPTLILTSVGFVECSLGDDCPYAWAPSDLLNDRETEHVVDLDPKGFTVRHPLQERLNDALLSCDLHAWLTENWAPVEVGHRYRVSQPHDKAANWVRLQDYPGGRSSDAHDPR